MRLWRVWSELSRCIGDFQARLLLTMFYFLLLAPWGLLVRLLRDPLDVRSLPAASSWQKREAHHVTMATAQRQF